MLHLAWLFILAHLPIICGAAYAALEYWLGQTKVTQANSVIALVLVGLRTIRDRGKAAMLLVLMGATAAMSCAYCKELSNRGTVGCKTLRAIQECGPKALAIIAAELGNLLSGDSERFLFDVLQQAPEEYDCVEQAIEAQIVEQFGRDSEQFRKFIGAEMKVHEARRAQRR